jgi:DNA-binding MarR family transcriptional regulator
VAPAGFHVYVNIFTYNTTLAHEQQAPAQTLHLMDYSKNSLSTTRLELANRLFFRLYQCANMLHKTGSRAVEDEGLTTQQWAVLGALSRAQASSGMSIGELARYLMVSRQNLSGLIGRMERDGHVAVAADDRDRRSRVVTMTDSGRHVWQVLAQPKIRAYYERILADFSTNDLTHTLHYLLKMLDNMQRLDAERGKADEDGG